jgi:hypothetical protein
MLDKLRSLKSHSYKYELRYRAMIKVHKEGHQVLWKETQVFIPEKRAFSDRDLEPDKQSL